MRRRRSRRRRRRTGRRRRKRSRSRRTQKEMENKGGEEEDRYGRWRRRWGRREGRRQRSQRGRGGRRGCKGGGGGGGGGRRGVGRRTGAYYRLTPLPLLLSTTPFFSPRLYLPPTSPFLHQRVLLNQRLQTHLDTGGEASDVSQGVVATRKQRNK